MKSSLAILLGCALAAMACGDAPSSPSFTDTRLFLRLSNSAFPGAKAILVRFTRVQAARSPRDLIAVPLPNGAAQFTCDLQKLLSSDGEIAGGAMPAGEYTEVRLLIQSATLYLDNPTADAACAANFRIPGGGRAVPMTLAPSEVVIARSFRVDAGGDTTMRIGLNTEQSIRSASGGAYTFSPVITVLSVS